ncbi:tautomerase family protein [Ferribacterium limneticum]|uniref:tautomerase family protein n=1 Tax=Ferribacterium limneticum TaxID=76259 RepID=UPI001CFB9776|nr:tautomerase family protein [Ferribacterium limneticum]UCV27376.1 tautomerase family protein [Ferribacterium limneticum]UCV31293.1 tautomerase family protein [Ferribacterium limneticum]
MPLVRIDIKRNPDPSYAKKLGKVVYDSMKAAIHAPDQDNFQVLAEHDDEHFVYDPAYLGINRSDGLVFIQITLNEGRSTDQKKLLYKTIAEGLHREAGVRPEDVFINLVEVKKENWSFGNGVAQYAT